MGKFLHLGARLSEERERLGFGQTEFAAMMGVARKTQYNYEIGESAPDGSYLASIIEKGADVQYILTGIRTPQTTTLSPREAALLDNYRNVDDEFDKKVIERTAFLAATAETEAEQKKQA